MELIEENQRLIEENATLTEENHRLTEANHGLQETIDDMCSPELLDEWIKEIK